MCDPIGLHYVGNESEFYSTLIKHKRTLASHYVYPINVTRKFTFPMVSLSFLPLSHDVILNTSHGQQSTCLLFNAYSILSIMIIQSDWGVATRFHHYHSSKGPSKHLSFRGTNSILTYHLSNHESDHAKISLYKYRVKISFD